MQLKCEDDIRNYSNLYSRVHLQSSMSRFLNVQKLVKTNTSPMRYQPLMRTATDWVSCVLCAMVTLGSGLP